MIKSYDPPDLKEEEAIYEIYDMIDDR